MELYSEAAANHPLDGLDDLFPTRTLPVLPPYTIPPSLSCSLLAGILTKALLSMEQITDGEHMVLDQVVRKLMEELLLIL